MCLVTKLEIKIEIRLPFWSLTKIRLSISGHQLGSQGSSLNGLFFKLLSYLAKRHIFNKFGSQSGYKQIGILAIRTSIWQW